jgi:hypothetical protein
MMDKPGDTSSMSLEFIRTYLVKPLADQFEREMREIREQLLGMRKDFRDALDQNGATLRTITDAESGYVPRSEYQLMQSKYDLAIQQMQLKYDTAVERLNERFDGLFRWVVTTGIACAGMALEVVNLATHHN